MAMIPQAYERRRAAAVADRAPHNMQPEPVTCGHGTRAGDHAAYMYMSCAART